VKLVVREAESGALRADLHRRSGLATSRLGVVEAERAIRRTMAPPLAEMRAVFDTVDIVEVSPSLMAQAGGLTPVHLRTLDAIHLATLLLLGAADLDVVTYDDRLVAARVTTGSRWYSRGGVRTRHLVRGRNHRAATARTERDSRALDRPVRRCAAAFHRPPSAPAVSHGRRQPGRH
jgi:uncharacterized protein